MPVGEGHRSGAPVLARQVSADLTHQSTFLHISVGGGKLVSARDGSKCSTNGQGINPRKRHNGTVGIDSVGEKKPRQPTSDRLSSPKVVHCAGKLKSVIKRVSQLPYTGQPQRKHSDSERGTALRDSGASEAVKTAENRDLLALRLSTLTAQLPASESIDHSTSDARRAPALTRRTHTVTSA